MIFHAPQEFLVNSVLFWKNKCLDSAKRLTVAVGRLRLSFVRRLHGAVGRSCSHTVIPGPQ